LLPTSLDRDGLRAVDPRSVILVKWPPPLKTKFYRNLLPELQISICPECMQAFHSEDFELQVLQKGHCPFCRVSGETLLNSH
jgi:intraflagellar transport protein 122